MIFLFKIFYLFVLTISLPLFAQIHSPEMDLTDPFQQEVLSLIPLMEDRIGRTLPIPVVVWNPARQISDRMLTMARGMEHAYAWTLPAFVGSDGKWEEDGGVPSIHSCLIYFNPSGYLSTGAQRTAFIAHEIYHCFQFTHVGLAKVLEMPSWIIEGAAEFAGELFADGTARSEPIWTHYLTNRLDITALNYHALGLFASIHSMGLQNTFEVVDQLLTTPRDESWLKLGMLLSTEEKSSLSSMAKMKNEWGENYFITFPQIPNNTVFPIEFMGEIFTPSSTPIQNAVLSHYQYTLPLNMIVNTSILGDAYGRIRITKIDGTMVLDSEIMEGQNLKICRGPLCGCPNGNDAYDVIKLEEDALNVQFYVTAFSAAASLEFSQTSPGCCPGSLGVDSRIVGTWKLENDLLMTAMRPQPNVESENIQGEHIVRINTSGVISRSGFIKTTYKWINGRTKYKEIRILKSRVFGCIETRATGANKGWIFHRELTENSNHSVLATKNGRLSTNVSKQEEYPFIRWGTGTTGTNGIYEISGDTLRIRGEPRTYIKTHSL